MPVEQTTKVTAWVSLENYSDKVYVEAIPWVNNMFRLVRAVYWTDAFDVPQQRYINHRSVTPDMRAVILDALVCEWNAWSHDAQVRRDKCCLVLECDPAAGGTGHD